MDLPLCRDPLLLLFITCSHFCQDSLLQHPSGPWLSPLAPGPRVCSSWGHCLYPPGQAPKTPCCQHSAHSLRVCRVLHLLIPGSIFNLLIISALSPQFLLACSRWPQRLRIWGCFDFLRAVGKGRWGGHAAPAGVLMPRVFSCTPAQQVHCSAEFLLGTTPSPRLSSPSP